MKQDRAFPKRQQIHAQREPMSPTVLLEKRSWSYRDIPVVSTVIVAVMLTAIFVGAYLIWKDNLPPALTVNRVFDPIQVIGTQGCAPVVTMDAPLSVDETEVEIRFKGLGREIGQGTPVLLSVSAFDAHDGTNLRETGAPALVVGTASSDSIGSTLTGVVIGKTEGSRLLVARNLDSGATEINVVDILYTIAKGTIVDDVQGPLTVTPQDGAMAIVPNQDSPPTEITVQVLIQGQGTQVLPGNQVVAQYQAVAWSNGELRSSTWAEGTPKTINLETAMPGIREALVDQRVGSRVAITVPPEKATGDDTLCVVVDILGTSTSVDTELNDQK